MQQLIATVSTASPLHITTQDDRTFPAHRIAGYQPEPGDLVLCTWAEEPYFSLQGWVILGRIV